MLKQVRLRESHNAALQTLILVSPSGRTLYHLTAEKGKKIACTGQCAAFWPPLLIKRGAKPSAGPGINAKKLGTIRRPDGKFQVTYNGLSLYLFLNDKKAGDVNGQGFQKIWFAISPTGRLIRAKPAAGTGG